MELLILIFQVCAQKSPSFLAFSLDSLLCRAIFSGGMNVDLSMFLPGFLSLMSVALPTSLGPVGSDILLPALCQAPRVLFIVSTVE
jgi:hypothetical protein